MNRRTLNPLVSLVPSLVAAAILIVVWDVVIRVFDIKDFLAPSPWEMLAEIQRDSKTLMLACLLTGRAAVTGLIASVVLGTVIGFLFSQVGWLRRAFFPYAIFLQTVPIVAIAPILVLWIGNGIESVIAVSFILGLFPIITNVTSGMMSVPTEMVELFQLNRANAWQRFAKLQFPFTLPYLLTGVKIAGGLTVIGAIVGEFFVGYGNQGKGLGYMIRQSVEMNRTPQLFAVVFLSTLLGVFFFAATSCLDTIVLRKWSDRT